jgi:hypothetical protein
VCSQFLYIFLGDGRIIKKKRGRRKEKRHFHGYIFFTEFLFSSQNLDLNGMREKPFIGTAINNVQQSIGHLKKEK